MNKKKEIIIKDDKRNMNKKNEEDAHTRKE